MPQSLSAIHIHLVFATKGRHPFLRDEGVRQGLYSCLDAVSRRLECPLLAVGGTADHMHLHGRVSRVISIADWVKELKRVSSIWVKKREQGLEAFAWQGGYGAFAVNYREVDRLDRYIANQMSHHRCVSFEEEYRALLRAHAIPFDERYVWD